MAGRDVELHRSGRRRPGALAQDERPRRQVPQALVVLGAQHRQHRSRPAGEVEVDQGEESPHGSVAEAHRRSVAGHHSQPQRRLAGRAATPQRLEGDRVAEQHGGEDQEQHHHAGGVRRGVGEPEQGDGSQQQQPALDGEVDERTEEPGAQSRRLELQHHRLRCDEPVHLLSHVVTVPADPYRSECSRRGVTMGSLSDISW